MENWIIALVKTVFKWLITHRMIEIAYNNDSNCLIVVVCFHFNSIEISEIFYNHMMMVSITWKSDPIVLFVSFLGVLTDIQASFNIKDDDGGLLQTVFIISYMIFAPIFGYLGDRFSRKWIMAFGITLWGATTLLGSFMNSFGWFLMFRALVGIGEASYSTIAPTLLSDLFVHDLRSKMLAVFYFAIPVGSGLGWVCRRDEIIHWEY